MTPRLLGLPISSNISIILANLNSLKRQFFRKTSAIAVATLCSKPDDSPNNEQSSTHNHGIVHNHIHLSAHPDDPESTNPLIMELDRLKSNINTQAILHLHFFFGYCVS